VASKIFFEHASPAPHIDSVESVIDYRVPPEFCTPLAAFGSREFARGRPDAPVACPDRS
jgi:hypothetical protein